MNDLGCNNVHVISLNKIHVCYILLERQEANLSFELQSDE